MKKLRLDILEEMSTRRDFMKSLGKLLILASQAGTVSSLLKPTSAHASGSNLQQFVHIYLKGGTNMLSTYLSPTAKRSNSEIPENWKCIGLGNSFYPGPEEGLFNFLKSGDPGLPVAAGMPLYLRRIAVGGYRMPILWNSNIATSGGSQVKMSRVLQNNCSLVYGMTSSPAHDLAAAMFLEPRPGAPTLGGFIADGAADTVFGSISTRGAINRFKAPSGVATRMVRGDATAMEQLLSSLLHREGGAHSFSKDHLSLESSDWAQGMKSSIQGALQMIKNEHEQQIPGVGALFDLEKKARNELDNNVYESIVTEFAAAAAKYQSLINQAMSIGIAGDGLVGINDQGPILGFPTDSPCLKHHSTQWNASQDFKPFINSMTLACDSLPYEFALAEIAIKRKLSRSIQIGFDLQMYSQLFSWIGSDAHGTGQAIDLAVTSSFMYIFNTLLFEFIETLKNSGDYANSLVLVNSEFTRNPQANGAGSDHNFNGAMAALFSGRLPAELNIYGDVSGLESGTNYPGLFGQAGGNQAIDVRRLSYSIGKSFGLQSQAFNELGNFLTPIMTLNGAGLFEFNIPTLKDPIS